MPNKPYSLIFQKCLPISSFQTDAMVYFYISDYISPLLSLNPFYEPFFILIFLSKFFLSELYLSNLNLSTFNLSKQDSDLKSLYLSQKSFSFLYLLKNLLFCQFFWSIFWYFLLFMIYIVIWAKYYLHFLFSPIVYYLVYNLV